MVAIGALVFCDVCGNLLDANTDSTKTMLKCDACGADCKGTPYPLSPTSVPAFLPTDPIRARSQRLIHHASRRLGKSSHYALAAGRFPLVTARQAFAGADAHRRGHARRGDDPTDVRPVWEAGGPLLHAAAAQRRRGEHRVLHVRVWKQVCVFPPFLPLFLGHGTCGWGLLTLLARQVEYE